MMIKLSELREKQGISQKELGELIGVAQNTICNWEKGTREPNHEALIKLSKLFHVPVPHLLGQGIYAKKAFILNHLDSIYEIIKRDSEGTDFIDFIDHLKKLPPETQFKALTAFLLDVTYDEELKTIQLTYYI